MAAIGKNLIGERFGRLTVISFSHKVGKTYIYNTLCDCGNEKLIRSCNLHSSSRTKSCGCYAKEKPSHLMHGLRRHRLYRVWYAIKQRCYNRNDKRYNTYGKRGIKMCDEWLNDFKSFYDWCIANGWRADFGRRDQQIDRINNNGDYEPMNCRFVTSKVNNNNRIHYRTKSG